MAYYRDEWLVEHGFRRFKKGSLPALPLFLRLDERIRGLMLLLMVAYRPSRCWNSPRTVN
jgi:transposase